ncbi:MAG: hypothetical protein ACYC18_11640 [Gammaproteobacteria bacterium]|nr:hypothetical protein [Gammaproteobacteria bacterium]
MKASWLALAALVILLGTGPVRAATLVDGTVRIEQHMAGGPAMVYGGFGLRRVDRDEWRGDGGGWRGGWRGDGGDWGDDWGDDWGPVWAPPPVYYYPPRTRIIVTPPPPTRYVAPERQYFWYYCEGPKGYYPYVKTCPGGWMKVVPRAPRN